MGTRFMPKLTQALVEAMPVNGRDYFTFDTSLPGFAIRVTPIGTKLFVMQARVAGRKQRVTIGRYHDLTVVQARELALQALADMRRGADPATERKARIGAKTASEMTISQLADKWMADYVGPKLKPRTVFDYERLLAQHIKPALGHLSVAGIDRDDIVRLHVDMARIPRRANYVISTVRALINFGIDLGLRPPASNPARRIKMYRERARERFLSEIEIAKAADAIEQAERAGKIGPHGAAGLRLALFTGARSGEVTAIQWSHVDWERRLIRLPDSKTNEPRTIHLSEAALEVLKTVPRIGRFVIAGAKPDEPYKNLGRAWIDIRGNAGLADVRLHDLRHSYASLAAGRGVSLQMIGKLLGHKVAATTARYSHLARDAIAAVNDELGAAMQAAIAKGQPPTAKVVKLKRPRR
jgi:integrase